MQLILNSDTTHAIVFFLTASSDHITGLTGATPTVTISKNTAAYAAPAGTVAEIGNGFYKLTPATADVNANGMFLLHATAASADPCDVSAQVVAFSPYDAVALGLSDIPSILTQATTAATQATTAATEATIAAGFGAPPTAAANGTAAATAILLTPSHKLATDTSGDVTVSGYASGEDPATLVWNALIANFTVTGSFGETVQSGGGGGGPTLIEIVNGIWNEPSSSHTTTGTFGAELGAVPTAAANATAAAGAILVSPSHPLANDTNGALPANNLVTGLLDLANGVESSVTMRQALRLCAAVLGGVLSGAGGTTVVIQAANNPGTTRVTATVDTAGDRTALQLSL